MKGSLARKPAAEVTNVVVLVKSIVEPAIYLALGLQILLVHYFQTLFPNHHNTTTTTGTMATTSANTTGSGCGHLGMRAPGLARLLGGYYYHTSYLYHYYSYSFIYYFYSYYSYWYY